jgi:hypothetical protein
MIASPAATVTSPNRRPALCTQRALPNIRNMAATTMPSPTANKNQLTMPLPHCNFSTTNPTRSKELSLSGKLIVRTSCERELTES